MNINDIGIATKPVAVEGAHPIIVVRILDQAFHAKACQVANVSVLIPGEIAGKGIGRRDIKPIAARSG